MYFHSNATAAILDAILKITPFRKSDFLRLLVCYSGHHILQKTVEKPFVAIFGGWGTFCRKLTRLKLLLAWLAGDIFSNLGLPILNHWCALLSKHLHGGCICGILCITSPRCRACRGACRLLPPPPFGSATASCGGPHFPSLS